MAQKKTQSHLYKVKELIDGCKNGNERARSELFHLFAPKMLGLTIRYAKDKMEAEDILVIGFTKVFAKIETFSSVGSFEGWIRKIMVNTAISIFHQNKRKISSPINELTTLELIEQAYYLEDTEYLFQALRSLPDLLRQPFTLFAVEGYAHKEISRMLSISEELSKVRVLRARKLLQQRLKIREIRLNRIHYAA